MNRLVSSGRASAFLVLHRVTRVLLLVAAWLLASSAPGAAMAPPLRVFIRSGPKTHGPGQHDHPRFLQEWKALLNQRGLRADGAEHFPTANELAVTDVLIIHAADGATIPGQDRTNFETFLRRGGGFVVLHDGIVGNDPQWFKTIAGGAWENGHAKWYEGEVGEYFVDTAHPITRGISNFDWDDEIYYDLQMMPDAHVLATSFQSVFVIAPQLWVYEKTLPGGARPYRAFVSIPGHRYVSFDTPHYRALLLRGIAWAGGRTNVDEFCLPEELASLRYPEGGPTAPSKAASRLAVHPEFNLNLVASEPLIEKVISLDWDPKGRLWVAETPEYPNGRTLHRNDLMVHPERAQHPENYSGDKENRPAHDRICWLEDTDGDGLMDHKHVFYEGLELVTSFVFYRDGVIVAQAPDILWLRDTDDDGKADRVEKLYTGFGTFDAHAVINNFRWGMDGWIYSTIGYSAGQPKSGDGSMDFGRVTAGVIRFKPDGSAVEQVASGSCNTWGLDFGLDGELFYTTATCGEHFLHVVMPEKVLARGNIGNIRASAVLPDHQQVFPARKYSRQPYMQIDWVGMFTAAAGCCIYNGGAWPAQFDGSGFLSEPTVNIVHNDFLRPSGATFIASKEPGREATEFIAATDLWFRPIHTRVGPDGALYVVDFYNQAVVHNDPRGPAHGARNAATRPDRDHKFGRIWRVQHKYPKLLPTWELDPKKPEQLVSMLRHPNGWVRDNAQRLLQEQTPPTGTTIAALAKMAMDTGEQSYGRIHALWTLANLDALSMPVKMAVLNDNDSVVLKNAIRIAAVVANSPPRYSPAEDGVSASLEGASPERVILPKCNHPDQRVRLEAITSLAAWPLQEDAGKMLVELFPALRDPWLESAVIGLAANVTTNGASPGETNSFMFLHAAFESANRDHLGRLVELIVRQLALRQDAATAARLLVWLSSRPRDTAQLKAAALRKLAADLKTRIAPSLSKPTPHEGELRDALVRLLRDPEPDVSSAVLPFIDRWDATGVSSEELKRITARLSSKLRSADLSDEARSQMAIDLLGVRRIDPSVLPSVAGLLRGDYSLPMQLRLVEALAKTGDAAARDALLETFPSAQASLKDAIFGELVQRPAWTREFVERLARRQLSLANLSPSYSHRLRTHPDSEVARLATATLDRLRGPEAEQKDTLIAKFKPAVEKPGSVDNGHRVFATNCAVCHMFGKEGRNLAPNLTGMGAHPPAELLIHILDPNRVVEPNFISQTVETVDDLNYSGIIERENEHELLLRNAAGDYTIQQKEVKSRRSSGLSLMPEGFEQLGAENLRDLMAFIGGEQQRFRIIDLRSVFTADTTRGIYSTRENTGESLQFRRFGTLNVGEIPFEIVSPLKSLNGNNVVVLRSRNGMAREYPRRVEIVDINLRAVRLHFLGGVGGWAWPWGGDATKGLPAASIAVTYADGTSDSWTLVNGIDITDYSSNADVPGSRPAEGLLNHGQVRVFSKTLTHKQPIKRITLESMNNQVAPTFIAITAETDGGIKTASQVK